MEVTGEVAAALRVDKLYGVAHRRRITRNKVQQIKYPSPEDPDPLKLIKTFIGNGQINKLSINLSSRQNQIELIYDTE